MIQILIARIGLIIVVFLLSVLFGCVFGCVDACVSLIRGRPIDISDQRNNAKETTPDAPPSYDELTVTTTVMTN